MTAQFWLTQKEVQQLLNFLLDKLDQAAAQGKTLIRPLKLDTRSFPALYKAEFESAKEQAWGYVERLAKEGWIRLKLDKATRGTASYELNPRVEVLNERAIREATGRLARVKSHSEQWREAVMAELTGPAELKDLVSRKYLIKVPGRTALEIVIRLNQVHTLAEELLLLREASSRLFWNQSKVLNGRQALVAALLNREECPFPDMPIQLQVYLPAGGFTGVLFIENQTTFEQASRDTSARYAGLALVFSSGFKGSAKRIRTRTGASLYLASHGNLASAENEKLNRWLFDKEDLPCWFWGDLDYAGMGILAALRASFPVMQAWQPGYQEMLDLLEAGEGHEPEQAGKLAQYPVSHTGCAYADSELIPALALHGRFLDQEVI